jgi:hypothetical protein
MFAVLAIVLCCAVVSLVAGIVAFLGRSKKDKKAANQETAITREERS